MLPGVSCNTFLVCAVDSFLEPNGFIRIVKYSSDKHGFRADVAHHVPSGKKEIKHGKSDSYFPAPKNKHAKQSPDYPYV